MNYIKWGIVGFCLIIAVGVYFVGMNVETLSQDNFETWKETKPICQEVCELNNGQYRSHQVALTVDTGKHDSLVCSCKSVNAIEINGFVYQGVNMDFKLRRGV